MKKFININRQIGAEGGGGKGWGEGEEFFQKMPKFVKLIKQLC